MNKDDIISDEQLGAFTDGELEAEETSLDAVELDDFWIDTYEVTNRQYKAFVDDGGYRDDRWWPEDVDRGAFVDTTGRPGPAVDRTSCPPGGARPGWESWWWCWARPS